MTRSKLLWTSFLSGVFAIGCCVSPVFLALLGIVSVSSAVALAYNLYGNYAWYFRIVGLVILGIAFYYYLKKKRQCSIRGAYKNRGLIVGSLIIFVVTYIVIYWITTLLGILVSRG